MALRVLNIPEEGLALLYGYSKVVEGILRMRSEDPDCQQPPDSKWEPQGGYQLRARYRHTNDEILELSEITVLLQGEWVVLWADESDCFGIYRDTATGFRLYYLDLDDTDEVLSLVDAFLIRRREHQEERNALRHFAKDPSSLPKPRPAASVSKEMSSLDTIFGDDIDEDEDINYAHDQD